MTKSPIVRSALFVALAALALGAGGRFVDPASAEAESTDAARSWRGEVRRGDYPLSGFHPARCGAAQPAAELLALADWPLDADGRTCVGPAAAIVLDPVQAVEAVEDAPPVIRVEARGAPVRDGTGDEAPLALAAVADEELAALRGGFELPGGLVMSFGIERLVYINGNLTSTTRVSLVELGELVGAGGNPAAPALAVGSTVALIQNGPNNTATDVFASGALATVIQNSLNDQRIQTVTTINAQVNAMEALRAQRFAESLRDAARLQ